MKTLSRCQSYTPTEENEIIQFTININLVRPGYSVFQISISKLAVIQNARELLFEFRERTDFITNVEIQLTVLQHD